MKPHLLSFILSIAGGILCHAQSFNGHTPYSFYLQEHMADFQKGNSIVYQTISYGNDSDSGILRYSPQGLGTEAKTFSLRWGNGYHTSYLYNAGADNIYQLRQFWDSAAWVN